MTDKYRKLQKFATEQFDQLAANVEDKSALASVPMIDEKLLESIEEAAGKENNYGVIA